MKKIEFLTDIAHSMWGKSAKVYSAGNGQKYIITYTVRMGQRAVLLWIDTLKGGRVSIKIKGFRIDEAVRCAKALWNAVYYSDKNYVLDAKAKADIYKSSSPSMSRISNYVARLRMDKVWE